MKKRIFALMIAAVVMATSAMPVLASAKDPRYSPENVTITPTPVVTPPSKSPKTGEVDFMLYGGLGAAAFGSVAVFALKKKEEA
jgi:LPXTG-motif cell wall-anchored protein